MSVILYSSMLASSSQNDMEIKNCVTMHGINIWYRYFGKKPNLLYNHSHKTYIPYFTAMIRSYSSKYQLLVSMYIFVHWMITSKIIS